MDNVTNFLDRSKEFEQAHCTCKELLDERIYKIERFVCRWLLGGLAVLFVLILSSVAFFQFEIIKIKNKVDHRYFLTKESLESIHKVKIENGNVIRNY